MDKLSQNPHFKGVFFFVGDLLVFQQVVIVSIHLSKSASDFKKSIVNLVYTKNDIDIAPR